MPYGIARHSASLGKSCALTTSGCVHHRVPLFLKLPISSEFFVSTLMTGALCRRNKVRIRRRNRNCRSRSGCGGPVSRLTFVRNENPALRNNRPTVRYDTRPNRSASDRKLLLTYVRRPVASPPVSGSTIFFRSPSIIGSFFRPARAPLLDDGLDP